MSSFTTASGLSPGTVMLLDLDDVESVLAANYIGNLSGLHVSDRREDLIHDVVGREDTELTALRLRFVVGVALCEFAEVLARNSFLVRLISFGFGGSDLGRRRIRCDGDQDLREFVFLLLDGELVVMRVVVSLDLLGRDGDVLAQFLVEHHRLLEFHLGLLAEIIPAHAVLQQRLLELLIA